MAVRLADPVFSPARRQPRPGMVFIRGGVFTMGSDHHYPEEAPTRRVAVDGFWIDAKPVTNRQFERFVHATSWITTAERPADPSLYPDAPPEKLAPASLVFTPPPRGRPITSPLDWWSYRPGADWRHPSGPESSLKGLQDHPVVHVSWEDVAAYAGWAGVEIPTEAEWEFAARGGLADTEFAWGDELTPGGRHMANTWQGAFPFENTMEDGWARTSPAGAYPPNGYGLYDMIGNVWEWTRDWWSLRTAHEPSSPCCGAHGHGPEQSYEPGMERLAIPRRVTKGGSHLCAPNYCRRYRPAARQPQPVDTSASHVGFRCVVRPTGAG